MSPARRPVTPVEAERRAALRSWCSKCRKELPWTAFYSASVWPDGAMRTPHSWCKECVKADNRERRRRNPERAREIDRRAREKERGDPIRWAKRQRWNRELGVDYRVRQRESRLEEAA